MIGLRLSRLLLPLCAAISTTAVAQSQNAPQQIDPGIVTKTVAAPPVERRAPEQAHVELPPAAGAPAARQPIIVGAIRVDGADDLPSQEMMAAISSYIGHRLSSDDVQDLLTAVSGVARAHGYLFAHSAIPPQTLTAGVLRIALDKGQVDEVRVIGDARPAVAAILKPLEGHAPKREEVERRLMIAGDLPGVTVGDARYAIEAGRGVLIVRVAYRRVDGSAAIDNRGLDALGPERARLTVNLNGLLGDSDQVTFQGLATPIEPHELIALYGRYAIQPTANGTQFAISGSYGETHSGGRWSGFDPRGRSDSIGISVAQPLLRSAKTSLWLIVEGQRTAVDEWWNGALVRRDRVTTIGGSINGYTPLAGGWLRAGGEISQALMVMGATPRDNPLASRYDAGSDFTMVSAWANWQGDLAGPFSARLAATAQLASAPLPAVEQLTIGGPYFGRGYNWSERSGDEGVLGSAELRARVLNRTTGTVRSVQLYTFGDAGYVRNLKTDFGTGDLYSAGAGARITLGKHLNLEIEAAFPINADRYDSGNKSPRLSFSLSSSF